MLFLIAVATLLEGGKNGVKSTSLPPFTYTAPNKQCFKLIYHDDSILKNEMFRMLKFI